MAINYASLWTVGGANAPKSRLAAADGGTPSYKHYENKVQCEQT